MNGKDQDLAKDYIRLGECQSGDMNVKLKKLLRSDLKIGEQKLAIWEVTNVAETQTGYVFYGINDKEVKTNKPNSEDTSPDPEVVPEEGVN